MVNLTIYSMACAGLHSVFLVLIVMIHWRVCLFISRLKAILSTMVLAGKELSTCWGKGIIRIIEIGIIGN